MKFLFVKCTRHYVTVTANSLDEAKEIVEDLDMIDDCDDIQTDDDWEHVSIDG